MTKKTTLEALPDINQKPKFTEKLPILYSCRVRLDEEQRSKLKAAWKAFRAANTPAQQKPLNGSSVSAVTSYSSPGILGMSDLVVNDLIVSRDTIPLTTILNLASALNIELLDRTELESAFQQYLNYNYSVAAASHE